MKTLCGTTATVPAFAEAGNYKTRDECPRCVGAKVDGKIVRWGDIDVLRKPRGRVQHYVLRKVRRYAY